MRHREILICPGCQRRLFAPDANCNLIQCPVCRHTWVWSPDGKAGTPISKEPADQDESGRPRESRLGCLPDLACSSLQLNFWRKEVESRPLEARLAYIESQFPGSYGCGFEEDIFYPLPIEDKEILQGLWDETYLKIFGKPPGPHEGPGRNND
jgi:hypothetical protein